MNSGIQNPDSSMGCYACRPDDYETLKPFFKAALEKYHKVDLSKTKHTTNWDIKGLPGVPEDLMLDVKTLGINENLSMRVRTGRNLNKFPLPGAMTKDHRVQMELAMQKVFDALIADKKFGGRYVSITPDHKNFIDEKQYDELVKKHIMFKDMSADKYLLDAGIARDWPYGRGCYISEDSGFIIWVGEEDHLRIMAMQKGTVLNGPFDRLKAAIDYIESLIEGGCAKSEEFGVVTSCPTNIGTGMRASVHIKLPNLTKDGTDKQAKKILKPLGLSVRGLGGEHTPIGKDGTVDISPSARFCISEAEILLALFNGIKACVAEEAKASSGKGSDAKSGDFTAQLAKIEQLKKEWPDNIAVQCFDKTYFESLSAGDKVKLLECMNSGIQNPDSSMGCYACRPDDYETLKPFFKAALEKYHKVDLSKTKHTTNWDIKGLPGVPEDLMLDVKTLGINENLSMRVRTGRNLNKFPLPGAMTKDHRVQMELAMQKVFDALIADKKFGGRYVSITPDHKNFIDEKQYDELVKKHIMFKDMSADKYLLDAGIARDWPYGRGCYISEDSGFIIWVGEEDHLRIMAMQKGTVLNGPFDRLKAAIDYIESLIEGGCAKSEEFGVVTSCPTNIGTGMRASVHIKLPNLTKDGTDKQAKKILKPLGLSVRGLGGEHTPIGKDGTVDISPSARFCISEAEILLALYNGIKACVAEESKAASA